MKNPATVGGPRRGEFRTGTGDAVPSNQFRRTRMVPLCDITSGDGSADAIGGASHHSSVVHRSKRRPGGTLVDIYNRSTPGHTRCNTNRRNRRVRIHHNTPRHSHRRSSRIPGRNRRRWKRDRRLGHLQSIRQQGRDRNHHALRRVRGPPQR
jgi:hypothetical protein